MRSAAGAPASVVALGAILGLVVGCASGTPRPGPAHPPRASRPPLRASDLASIESEVVKRVNRYRRGEGLPALASNSQVAEIARSHSRAMAAGRTGFGHGGFKGRAKTLARRFPFERVAENVSHHSRDPREVPAVALARWVDSRSHRRNLEGPFALTGVGAAVAADGSVYLTQIFVLPR